MNHSNHTSARIIGSDENPLQQRSCSLSTAKAPKLSPSTTSRKRPREFNHERDVEKDNMSIDKKANDETNYRTKANESNGDKDSDEKLIVQGLRLEAIFHPKFDNERDKKKSGNNRKGVGKNIDGSSDIRSIMLQKLGIGSGLVKDGNSGQHAVNRFGETSLEEGRGKGHLEVSLKHSGSLVLWSGSTRYYSKNSACNEFTRMAEILLRQRFETVRKAISSSIEVSIDDNGNQNIYYSYEDCSRFVSDHRYTIAFEVVTAEMLGDHGQIPNRDYVVVTAVADRTNERFLSTTEVLKFCHRYRLPHNDVWTFFPPTATTSNSSKDTKMLTSAEALFQLYDNSLRETGYTEDTVRGLTDIADVYIPSPIPHSIYQGSICEGFIVRFVHDGSDGPVKERLQLEELAQSAQDILDEVPPPTLPTETKLASDNHLQDPVLYADVRALYRSIPYTGLDEHEESQKNEKPSSSPITIQRRRAALFSEGLKKVLQYGESESDMNKKINGDDCVRKMNESRCRGQRDDLIMIEKEKENDREKKEKNTSLAKRRKNTLDSLPHSPFENYHLPALTKNLVESQDKETKRIATLLQTLDGLNGGAVTYTWMERRHSKRDENLDYSNRSRLQGGYRLYCIIHVHNDSTFFKYQRLQRPTDMMLFRGFCIELLLGEEKVQRKCCAERDVELGKLHSKPEAVFTTDGGSGSPLMLKMKLLPYMVRTFICRNLLNTINQKGPEEFERIALGLLDKWNISPDAKERWSSFFRGWALYVLQYKAEQEQNEPQLHEQGVVASKNERRKSSPSIGDNILDLGPLTNFSYLRHLENFTKLYEAGQFRAVSLATEQVPPEFCTFVCIISQSTEVSLSLANHIANFINDDESSKNEKISIADAKMVVCSLGEAAKNRRSKSCIAYANIGDVTKGIKKFICDKKVSKQSIFLLLGSNRDEIIAPSTEDKAPAANRQLSWLDVMSKSEGKKVVNMWKSWKRFPCAKRIELGRSMVELQPKREGSTAAVITGVKDMKKIVGAIQGLGRSLIEEESKKQSNPSSGGILVFFPGIPGCGKSSLLELAKSKLEEDVRSQKVETGDIFDGKILIKEGDKIGKKFWNVIDDLLSNDDVIDGESPALVIADKNAPPASWPKLGQIGHGSNSIMLPVLPNSSALETTTIEGSIQPNGDFLPHASHFYPFSLKFLVVSLLRVLNRPPGEHAGKLDSGFPMACMVVVQFFSFYRYIGADTFQEKMNEKFDKDGAFSIKFLDHIELPFLAASAQEIDLPDDLQGLLEEALQLRHGHDKDKKFKVKKEDIQMVDLEGRLRASIGMHKETIEAMTVSLEDTTESFLAQIMDRIKCSTINKLEKTKEAISIDSIPKDDGSKNVKLVSLDIDRIKIHDILQNYKKSGILKNFFDSIESVSQLSSTPKAQSVDNESKLDVETSGEITTEQYPAPNFIENTHVTMAFAGEKNSAEALISSFRHLQGREVTISVTGFLWSSTNAALAIKISSCSMDECSVSIPLCENSFPHVTVWCAPDVKASLSNQLPSLVESGKAFRVDFDEEDLLIGKVSFWNHNNEPFVV